MNAKICQGHPRVLLRADDLPALRRRAATTHAAEMQSLLALAHAGAVPGAGDYADSIWRLSFLHLLSGDPAHARPAIDAVRRLLELEVSGAYWVGARRLKALSAAYDWMHGAIDADLRHRIGTRALEYCQALYDSGEIEPGCYFLGHAINQMPFVLMSAIAIGDEIDNGAAAGHFLEDMLRRCGLQMECYRAFLDSDCFQQSLSYTSTYAGELPYIFHAMEAGLGIEMYRSHPWLRNVVKWWTWTMRDDGSFLRFGDYFCAIPALENAQYYRPLAVIASRYRDGLAAWWVKRFQIQKAEPEQFLFEDRPGVAPVPPDDLPRTKFFGPMGLAVARGDFDRGTVAAFKCTPIYLHNHGHRDANSFTIYHRGELAIDSGAYDAYETPHWYNYYIRTIAHNTLVVHDPEEHFVSRGREYANDGGQRFINEPHFQVRTRQDMDAEVFRDGEVRAFREGDGWSYACGDASRCYSAQKLKRFVRHVVFVLDWPRRARVSMVVFDEVELARPGLEPRFLLHTMNEPVIDGNQITARHGGGRLEATVLLPEQAKIEAIGGAGHEFEVDGINYPLNRAMGPAYTPGAWRAEVTGGSGLSRQFLMLLVPDDTDAPATPRPTLESSEGGWIVRQGDLAVVLARPGRSIDASAARTIRVELNG